MPPDDATTENQEAPDDIRSVILAAVEAQEAAAEEPKPEATTGADRARGADGKFIRADAETIEEPIEEVAPEKAAVAAEPVADVKPGAEPPPNWSDLDKATFRSVPTEAQAFLLRRHGEMEADYTRKTQENAALSRDYGPVRQVLEPFSQQIRQAGYTPATLVQAWANVERALTDGRGVAVIRDLVTNYRLDRAQIARELGLGGAPAAGVELPPAPNGQQTLQLPPEVAAKIQTLESQTQQVAQVLAMQHQAQQRETASRVMNMIQAFRDAKDGSGNLLHPHYDEIENDMVALVAATRSIGQEPALEDLYERAVWANTSTREKTLAALSAATEAQRKATEDKARAEARAKAERARKAGSSVTGAPGQAAVPQTRKGELSVRDALLQAYEEVAGNA